MSLNLREYKKTGGRKVPASYFYSQSPDTGSHLFFIGQPLQVLHEPEQPDTPFFLSLIMV